jgi:CRISPR-associated protein Cmr2
MISSNIQEFRDSGLTKKQGNQTLKLYGAPYTLYEIGGLIKTVAALKESEFPRSQLYQIRSLLEQGKRTVMLNYLYFRSRLKPNQQALLKQQFDEAWCQAKTNSGNIVPWMYETQDKVYETIWREMVDLYPFINAETVASSQPGDCEEIRI